MLYMAEKLITQTMETTNLSIQRYTSGPMVSLDAEILHALAQATRPPFRLWRVYAAHDNSDRRGFFQ
jgi:hypothetical protein